MVSAFLVMEVYLAEQTRNFISAAVLGLCLGGVYDVLRCVRALSGGGRWATALCDFLYAFVCTFSYFLFSLAACGGELRLYTALGAALAMFLYFAGLSPFVTGLLMPPVRLIRRAVCALKRAAGRVLSRAARHVRIWYGLKKD